MSVLVCFSLHVACGSCIGPVAVVRYGTALYIACGMSAWQLHRPGSGSSTVGYCSVHCCKEQLYTGRE